MLVTARYLRRLHCLDPKPWTFRSSDRSGTQVSIGSGKSRFPFSHANPAGIEINTVYFGKGNGNRNCHMGMGENANRKCDTTDQTRELMTACRHMMPPPLHVCNRLASPADAACDMYYEICEVIRYVAAPVWRSFEFSVVSCCLVPRKISPEM